MNNLSPKGLGLALGVFWGVALALWTLVVILTGTSYSQEVLGLIGSIYPGYAVSWVGVGLGLVYGFVDGLIGGALIAWLYNKFSA